MKSKSPPGSPATVSPACSLFESGINWGRVVALLGLRHVLASTSTTPGPGFLGQVTRFVADFVAAPRLHRPVDRTEGWLGECLRASVNPSCQAGAAPPSPHPRPWEPPAPSAHDPSVSPGRWQPWTWGTPPIKNVAIVLAVVLLGQFVVR